MSYMECCVFIATSLDGYIAKPNGDLKWLHDQEQIEGEDFGYKEFCSTIDAVVMGRKTFEVVMGFSKWPYEGKRIIVLSETMKKVPAEMQGKVELHSGTVIGLVKKLQNEDCKRIYVDGGRTIQSFLNLGLINEVTITIIPIILGDGISLFTGTNKELRLKHIATHSYANGFVTLKYNVIQP